MLCVLYIVRSISTVYMCVCVCVYCLAMVQYMMYMITSTAAAELLNGKLEMACLCTYIELKGYVY